MKKKIIYLSSMSIIASTLIFSNNAFAQEVESCPNGLNPSWDGSCDHTTDDDTAQQASCPNGLNPSWDGSCDHTTDDFIENPIVELLPEPVAEDIPGPGMSPGENAGWAIIDENGNTTNIIVCNPEACGSGMLGNNRVKIQTLQEDNGNVAAYMNSYYDFNQEKWIYIDSLSGAKYEILLGKPGFNNLVCLENCPPPRCEEDPNYSERDDCSHFVDGTSPIPISEIENFDSTEKNNNIEIIKRSHGFSIDTKGNKIEKIKIVFSKKVKRFNIIAKKWNAEGVESKRWRIVSNKKKRVHSFNVPLKYGNWRFILRNKNIKKITTTRAYHVYS